MTLGESIKKARIEKGYTQKQLGELCGMADSAIRRYENDAAKPKLSTLRRITDALGIHIFDLGPTMNFYSAEELQEDFEKSNKKIQITFSTKMPDSVEEKKRNDLIEIFNGLSSHGKDQAPHLLNAFSSLNSTGQSEAVKRVKELSKIEGYRKGDPEYDPEYERAMSDCD